MNLLCMLGFHTWTHTLAEYPNEQAERLALPSRRATRKCTCGAAQEEHEHCLGLNPPTYVKNWYPASSKQ